MSAIVLIVSMSRAFGTGLIALAYSELPTVFGSNNSLRDLNAIDVNGPILGGEPIPSRRDTASSSKETNDLRKTVSSVTGLVISQVFGGGGSSTGTYKYDYVEIKNSASVSNSLNGLILMYGSATGNFASSPSNMVLLPNLMLQPGQEFLVQLGNAGSGGGELPVTADLITTNITMSNANGKVALVTSSFTPNSCGATATPCSLPDANIVDLVAYGGANNAEGGNATNGGLALNPKLGNIRKYDGCLDTDNNNADFYVVANPVPRNTASPYSACSGVIDPTLLVVNTTADTDDGFCSPLGTGNGCSLREAIIAANGNSDTSTINFNIPAATDLGCDNGTGVCTISPGTGLPFIIRPVIINGYSQTGATPNTLAIGDDAAIKIRLHGAFAGSANGLTIAGPGCTIRGLSVTGFAQTGVFLGYNQNGHTLAGNFIGLAPDGITVSGNGRGAYADTGNHQIGGTDPADRNIISGNIGDGMGYGDGRANNIIFEGNYVGTDASGLQDRGNGGSGLVLEYGAHENVIGGTSTNARNLISGNSFCGIAIRSYPLGGWPSTASNTIRGNFIGVGVDGSSALGNDKSGICISGTLGPASNIIGGVAAGEGNIIANNGWDGITVNGSAPVGTSIRGNSIYGNINHGIDLNDDGVTANDTGDGDTGPNNLQNYPVITSTYIGGATKKIRGTLNSTPSTSGFLVDLYANTSCNAAAPNDYGEGEKYLGTVGPLTTDANGDTGEFVFNPATLAVGQFITATATDANGNTSEFSKCFEAVSGIVATHFIITAPSNATAGVPFAYTVTAVDDLNNVDTNYGGTVHFTSSDLSPAGLPADVTLVNGTGTFNATMFKAGVQLIQAYDLPSLSISGYSNNINVGAGQAYSFGFNVPSNVMPGVPFTFTVFAVDAYGNPGASGTGWVVFSSSDGLATVPENAILTNGIGTFTATMRTAGGYALFAKDISLAISGSSANINVSSLHFSVSAPAAATAGSGFNFTVTARDQFNNAVTDYTGTVHFTSSDPTAVLPADAALVNGTGTFAATLNSEGSRTITATDKNAPVTGTSNVIDVTTQAAAVRSIGDFDGDGRTDVSVFRSSEGNWYVNGSNGGLSVVKWGAAGDRLIPGDYDGDGKADYAVWRPSDTAGTADFHVLNSNGFTYSGYEWGSVGDVPVPGDYDGDGQADIAVYRPTTGEWWIYKSQTLTGVSFQFGSPGDVPLAMDIDGDSKADLAVYRPSDHAWYMAQASGTPAQNFTAVTFGLPTDVLVPADYDGDGRTDMAVFRPDEGNWYILRSTDSGVTAEHFGLNGDIPVAGDYDGDGKADIAVFRPTESMWYLMQTTSGFSAQAFGTAGDVPIPAAYHP